MRATWVNATHRQGWISQISLELQQKQNQQIQRQNDHLQQMTKAKENKPIEDNSHMFKRLVSHNPTTYNGAPDPKAFEDWIRGMEKC